MTRQEHTSLSVAFLSEQLKQPFIKPMYKTRALTFSETITNSLSKIWTLEQLEDLSHKSIVYNLNTSLNTIFVVFHPYQVNINPLYVLSDDFEAFASNSGGQFALYYLLEDLFPCRH